jgi:tuberous sclerosis protein 2
MPYLFHLQKELLTLLLSCLGVESEKQLPIADSNALIGFITIASNVFKYNFYTIEDEPKVELVKSICLISYATSDIKVVKECLSFFDIHVRYGSLSSSSVSLFISALCRTVNIESFCEQSWKIMENLLKGHCGHQGIRALCVLLEDSNNFNSVNLLRGAVFFLGMFNWGSHKISTLHSTPAGVLPSLMNVLACGQLIVAYEVVLSIRRLVKKYGKELTVEWDVVLQIISNLQPFATLVNTSLISMLEDTLSTIEALVEQRHFSGDTDRLREVLFSYTPLRPEKNVLRLLHRSARYLNPTYPSWVSELQRFLVTFFQTEHRSLIRIKALEALLEKWKMYSCVYDAEMLEEILPYFVGLATETDSNVCAKVLEALLVFASSNSKVQDAIQLSPSIFSSSKIYLSSFSLF